MKRIQLVLLVLAFLLAACAGNTAAPAEMAVLKVSDGTVEKTYTVDDLRALGESQAVFKEVTYVGVPLTLLLQDAGIDPAGLLAVKAVAADGFTANYEPALFMKEDTLVAYARLDGPLAEEDGAFRMVLPDQEGKLNPRMLTEIIAIR
jgi:DMSO/TMAO reductase YedYZ molybdopterin-dependent catalytic subunit